MKVAPVMGALAECSGMAQVLVHTGQHYDANMSKVFFEELGLPAPDVNLEVGSGSHAVQTAQIMMRFEEVVLAQKPDWVLVYGDVNSTVAAALKSIMEALTDVSKDLPLLFPVHPRTRAGIAQCGLSVPDNGRMQLVEPLGYLDFLKLQTEAAVVVTDSGGIQEETTYLGVPCITVRENTERPITVDMGTNVLVGRDTQRLREELARVLNGGTKRGEIPPLWDGKAGERIARVVVGDGL